MGENVFYMFFSCHKTKKNGVWILMFLKRFLSSDPVLYTVIPRFCPLPILSKFDFIHFSLLEISNKKLLKVTKFTARITIEVH